VFNKNEPKIDKPDEVAFAREIAKNLPGSKETAQIWDGLAMTYIAAKAYKGVRPNK